MPQSERLARLLGRKPQTILAWRLRGNGPRYIRLGEGTKAPGRHTSAQPRRPSLHHVMLGGSKRIEVVARQQHIRIDNVFS